MAEIDIRQLYFGDYDGPLNEQVVQLLVTAIRNKGALAMPVVAKWKDGSYTVIDGRLRIEAARRCGETTIGAYVLCGDDIGADKLREIRRVLNQDKRSMN